MERIEKLHSKELLHRDIKPDNYAMGLSKNCSTVYLLDYGLAKRYKNPMTKQHIPFYDNKRMVGTPRYCSLNAHMGYELSRRDDLESLGYCLAYMLKGNLPWQGVRGEDKNEKVLDLKNCFCMGKLCKGLPNELIQYINYCRSLKFEEEPSYTKLHTLLSELFFKSTCFKEFKFDWNMSKFHLNKKGLEKEKNSAKAEYEGMIGVPQRSMSRRIEIQNLVSGSKVLLRIDTNALPPEEKKEANKSSSVVMAGRSAFHTMKSSSLLPEKWAQIKRVRTPSQGNLPNVIDKKLQYFIEANPEMKKQEEVEDKVFEDRLCNFLSSDIAEHLTGINYA